MSQTMTIGGKFKIPQERMEQIYEDREIKEFWQELVGKSEFQKLFPLPMEQTSLKGTILSEALKKVVLQGMNLKEAVIAGIVEFETKMF